MEDFSSEAGPSPGRRPVSYWFSDGLPEIVAGLQLIAFSCLGMLLAHFAPELAQKWRAASSFRRIATEAQVAVYLMLLIQFDYRTVESLKARLTYPRTGYVQRPNAGQPPVITTLFTRMSDNVSGFYGRVPMVLLAGIGVLGWLPDSVRESVWGLPGALTVVALLLYWLNRRQVPSYGWAALVPLPLAGLVWKVSNLPTGGLQWFALALEGAWISGVGASKLYLYLRRHPHAPTALEV